MLKARNQADNYARAVAKDDGWPPFLMVVDVGHVIELYADFSRQGQGYNQFPDGNRYRIFIDELHDEDTRDLLRTIWTDPYSLDPSLKSAEVTRDIAEHLAELGKSFESQGHNSEGSEHWTFELGSTLAAMRFLVRAEHLGPIGFAVRVGFFGARKLHQTRHLQLIRRCLIYRRRSLLSKYETRY